MDNVNNQTLPIITVVIPFYCTPRDLFMRCLISVLASDQNNIEVLIINDGSPQSYHDTLMKAATDERVRVINASHMGVSNARNIGIREAKGEWITFVDSDDYVNTSTICRILDNINLFHGDVEIFNGGLDNQGRITMNTNFLEEGHNYAERPADKVSVMESALSVGIIPEGYRQTFSYGSPCCKLFRKDFLVNNGLEFNQNITFAEDTFFMLHVYRFADSVYFHDWPLYYYVRNEISSTRKYRPGISDEMNRFFDAVRSFIQNNHLESELEKGFYTRAQFEVRRSFYLEFNNADNKDPSAKQRYKAFINLEPYKTAIKKNYMPRSGFKQNILNMLIEHGCVRMYNAILWIHDLKSR